MKLFYFSIILFFSIFSSAQSPTFDWVKSLGGPNNDFGESVAVDALGNVYTVGTYEWTADLDPGQGVFNLSPGSIYISKLDASGSFVWAKNISNVGPKSVIKLDQAGNVFVSFLDSITKLTPAGNKVWTKHTGGNDFQKFTIDSAGNILICGEFTALNDFNSGPGVDTLRPGGYEDIFVLKLNNNGDFVWVKSIGGVFGPPSGANLKSSSIALNSSGSIFIAGHFTGTVDFDPSVASYTLSTGFTPSAGALFLLNLDSSGNFIWAKNTQGSGGILFDPSIIIKNSFIYVVGNVQGTIDFDCGPSVSNLSGGFFVKYNAVGDYLNGRPLSWSTGYLNFAKSVIIDAVNDIYILGYFDNAFYPDPNIPAFHLTETSSSSGLSDAFILKLDNNGLFLWASNFGSVYPHKGFDMVNDATGNIYVTGNYFGSCDFDMGTSTFTMAPQPGNTDAFILKLGNTVIGVEELSKNNSLIVFPNPNNGVLTIKTSSEGSYQLINNLSQTIKSFQLNTYNNFTITIDDLPQGIYTLFGKENNQTISQKIIVIK